MNNKVEIRGKVYALENISWGRAEPDVGIMSDYIEHFDLVDEEGKFWDWDEDQLTKEEDRAVGEVINGLETEGYQGGYSETDD